MTREAGKGDKRRPVEDYTTSRKSHHTALGSRCMRCHKVMVLEIDSFCDKCLKETE